MKRALIYKNTVTNNYNENIYIIIFWFYTIKQMIL